MSFTSDPTLQQAAEAFAKDACNFVQLNFRITLNWSEESVRQLESVMDALYRQAKRDKPSEEEILKVASRIGSYIGEVFRRNYGGEWGMVEIQGAKFPGFRLEPSKSECWPWGRVRNRVVNGSEDNIWHYYQFMISQAQGSPLKSFTDGSLPNGPK